MAGAVAGPAEAGERLDVALTHLAGISRSRAQRLIEGGTVLVDGGRRPKDHQLRPGEQVTWPDNAGEQPPGLVVHPAPGHSTGTLVNALLEHGIAGGHGMRPGIVHRLDRDTSGLMVVARNEAAYQFLVAALAARRIERTYSALIVGRLPQAHERAHGRPPAGRDALHRRQTPARLHAAGGAS